MSKYSQYVHEQLQWTLYRLTTRVTLPPVPHALQGWYHELSAPATTRFTNYWDFP
jgi:hypothetical protein